ncbi:MAG: hypothetical protein LPJ89_09505 [Hymenobacteraceae bacterium]|nr:hypothetical protein [Hymenobacteraceae bacterium]MDX5394960.1 hypothetical protein [Hymenobacteraceae bacterium]MDX5444001.1 hypothetical protein [Hymenobacteraceae bacterium]MDX5510994.1 hypothetical protein [Hymenobacteraceae bacterium]
MKINKNLLTAVVVPACLSLLFACNKTEDKDTTFSKPEVVNQEAVVVQDKQIRLEFGSIDINTRSNQWYLSPHETTYLLKFDKRNYPNISSIVFTGSLFTSNTKNKCMVELYNVTDSVAIANTTLESNANSYVFKETGNIYENLPDKEVTLAVRVKSERKDVFVSTGAKHILFLNRE